MIVSVNVINLSEAFFYMGLRMTGNELKVREFESGEFQCLILKA